MRLKCASNKVWNDNNNKAGKRPERITLKATGNGQGIHT